MISEMPWPICIRLSGIVGGRWEIVLGKKIKMLTLRIWLNKIWIAVAGLMTLSALRTVALRHIYLVQYLEFIANCITPNCVPLQGLRYIPSF